MVMLYVAVLVLVIVRLRVPNVSRKLASCKRDLLSWYRKKKKNLAKASQAQRLAEVFTPCGEN
jgi:predicted Holliday junction resolvase-like endonuclease